MKKFHQYLSESERTYNYRIKLLGDVPSGFIGDLKEKLKQFDIAKMSDKKTTPVQHLLKDFPGAENDDLPPQRGRVVYWLRLMLQQSLRMPVRREPHHRTNAPRGA